MSYFSYYFVINQEKGFKKLCENNFYFSSNLRPRKKLNSTKVAENKGQNANALFFLIDMHPDLMEPSEYFGNNLKLRVN